MGVRCKRAVTSYLQRSWKIVVLGGDSQLASFEFEAARKIREIQAKVNATVSSILAKVELGPTASWAQRSVGTRFAAS